MLYDLMKKIDKAGNINMAIMVRVRLLKGSQNHANDVI